MSCLNLHIVVGIDFETTYSGVAWAHNEGQKRIYLIKDWPSLQFANTAKDKVPSLISYLNGQVDNWGDQIGLRDAPLHWIKLLLEPNSRYNKELQQIRQCNELPKKLNMTADEVVRDYLKEIWKYTKEDIRKCVHNSDWENNFVVRVILTVPAMWSHAAKDKTLQAALAAGLPSSIRLVDEPEEDALATLRDKADDNMLRDGDAFVVCDAGGGTVLQINSVKPLNMEQCTINESGLYGFAFLDMAFLRNIKVLVGESQYDGLKDQYKNMMLMDLESGVKPSFTSESTKQYSVNLMGVEDNEKEGILDATITLKQYVPCYTLVHFNLDNTDVMKLDAQ
ncbi:hypothetical protein ACHAP5_010343 [Fusarium lateritium]